MHHLIIQASGVQALVECLQTGPATAAPAALQLLLAVTNSSGGHGPEAAPPSKAQVAQREAVLRRISVLGGIPLLVGMAETWEAKAVAKGSLAGVATCIAACRLLVDLMELGDEMQRYVGLAGGVPVLSLIHI